MGRRPFRTPPAPPCACETPPLWHHRHRVLPNEPPPLPSRRHLLQQRLCAIAPHQPLAEPKQRHCLKAQALVRHPQGALHPIVVQGCFVRFPREALLQADSMAPASRARLKVGGVLVSQIAAFSGPRANTDRDRLLGDAIHPGLGVVHVPVNVGSHWHHRRGQR